MSSSGGDSDHVNKKIRLEGNIDKNLVSNSYHL